jgi:Ser/Thr protein kinase RdoA (MazF antagonist)
MWMKELSEDTELNLPEVFTGKNCSLIQKFPCESSGKIYRCCMFSFLEGTALKDLSGKELFSQLEKTGAILAKLHIQSQTRDISRPLKRFSWDIDDLLGKDARWGNWRGNESLNKKQTEIIEKAVKRITARVISFGKAADKFGLIHADLHCSNIIVSGDKLQILDFDDCGYGYFLYDFGCSLVEYSDELEKAAEALIRGYERIKPLSREEKKDVNTFILLRRIVRLAWLAGHSQSDTAKTVSSGYIEKTCRLAEEFI